jgi:hypothetical protein
MEGWQGGRVERWKANERQVKSRRLNPKTEVDLTADYTDTTGYDLSMA